MSLSDDYDDDLLDSNTPGPSAPRSANADRIVRKRSSKACDNCRKAKCKCERAGVHGEPCRNCVLLGAECTFLGPSRKRGPPKGYIDAIESKLHQMEALLGTIITSSDPRARSLVADLASDQLARDIIQRVEDSPFGTRGRKQAAASRESYGPGGVGIVTPTGSRKQSSALVLSSSKLGASGQPNPRFGFVQPPHEWQDDLSDRIHNSIYAKQPQQLGFGSTASQPEIPPPFAAYAQSFHSSPQSEDVKPNIASEYDLSDAGHQHQRRRLEASMSSSQSPGGWGSNELMNSQAPSFRGTTPPLNLIDAQSVLTSNNFPSSHRNAPAHSRRGTRDFTSTTTTSHRYPSRSYANDLDDEETSDSELVDSIGQLSINEHRVVRYHGKASGLHLLMPAMNSSSDHSSPSLQSKPGSPASTGATPASTGRVNRGIWEFAAARVWPPLDRDSSSPSAAQPAGSPQPYFAGSSAQHPQTDSVAEQPDTRSSSLAPDAPAMYKELDTRASQFLPDLATQESLLGIYFAHIHPYLPVVHRKQFWADWRIRLNDNAEGRDALGRVPNVLLLSMFALASRYSSDCPPPAEGKMWTAGDDYFDHASRIVAACRALSKIEFVQSLLLLGYREIGLGGMAHAWLLIGVAIRLAQDMGLHRSMAKWQLAGSSLFTPMEKEIRSRVWYSCVRMDKYVSTFIGRPQTVHERDYDTLLPALDDDEETEVWENHYSLALGYKSLEECRLVRKTLTYHPVPSRTISCFNASAALSSILSSIMLHLYSTRLPSASTRLRERALLEEKLEKWYIDLPEHLRFDVYSHKVWLQKHRQDEDMSSSARHSGSEQRGPPVPPPHILTLHMQYWCTVLLLHRPFIRPRERNASSPSSGSGPEHDDGGPLAAKAWGTCATAAQHITTVAVVYRTVFCMLRAPALFSYYIFSAAITQVTCLLDHPNDIQASLGLSENMQTLKDMSVVWPSAARAWDLLNDTKVDLRETELKRLLSQSASEPRKKRALDDMDMDLAASIMGEPSADVRQFHQQQFGMMMPSVSHALRGGGRGPSMPRQLSLSSSSLSSMQTSAGSLMGQQGSYSGSAPAMQAPAPHLPGQHLPFTHSPSIESLRHYNPSPLATSFRAPDASQQLHHQVARQSSVSSVGSGFSSSYDQWSQPQSKHSGQPSLPPLVQPHPSLPPPLPPIQHPSAHNPPELPFDIYDSPSSISRSTSYVSPRAGGLADMTSSHTQQHHQLHQRTPSQGSPHTPVFQDSFESLQQSSRSQQHHPGSASSIQNNQPRFSSNGYWDGSGVDPLADPSLLAYAPMLGSAGSGHYDSRTICTPGVGSSGHGHPGPGSHSQPSPPSMGAQQHIPPLMQPSHHGVYHQSDWC